MALAALLVFSFSATASASVFGTFGNRDYSPFTSVSGVFTEPDNGTGHYAWYIDQAPGESILRGYDLLDQGQTTQLVEVNGTFEVGPEEIGFASGVALAKGPDYLFVTDTGLNRLLAYPRHNDESPEDPVDYVNAVIETHPGGNPIFSPLGVVINNTTHLGYMSYDTTPGERAVMTFNPVPNAGSIDSSISVSNTLSWVGGNGPRALAVDESRDHLYMAMEGMGHIEMTSGSSTENVIRVLTGPTNDDYVSLSVNATSNRLFAAKADSIDVFSLETGALLGTVTGFTFNGNTKGISAVEGWNRVFFATTNVPQLVDLESLAEPVCTPEAPVDVVAGSSVTFTPSCTDADDSTVEEFEITNAQSRGDADPTVDRAAIKYSANSVGQDDIAYRVTTQNGWSIEKHQLVNVSAAPVTPPTEPEVPVVRKTTNLVLESGDVYIKLPGSNEFVKLTKDMLIPIGTVIDAREGRAHLTLANADGTLYDGVFWDGIFQVTQGSGNKPITTLKLRDDLVARAAGFATARTSAELERSFYAYTAKKRGKKKNGLWGDGKGKFKTSGKGGSATVRGTRWYVANYANGSLFKVSRGSVTIDPIRGRNFVLKAGKSFFIFYKR